MGVKLLSTSGGSVEVVAPATASSFTATMPAGTGTVAVNGASTNIVSGTAQASTSGTSIDFTSIPSWVKRITVMFNGVSTSGTSLKLIQIGSGSVQSTGYVTNGGVLTIVTSQSTAGFPFGGNAAADVMYCTGTLTQVNTNIWQLVLWGNFSSGANLIYGTGTVTLSGTLDRVRATTINGTDTFDAGTINILYE